MVSTPDIKVNLYLSFIYIGIYILIYTHAYELKETYQIFTVIISGDGIKVDLKFLAS